MCVFWGVSEWIVEHFTPLINREEFTLLLHMYIFLFLVERFHSFIYHVQCAHGHIHTKEF